jgi:hypothetical protein
MRLTVVTDGFRSPLAILVIAGLCASPSLPSSASAQEAVASLRGRVVDQQGGVLPGTSVVARSEDSGLFREATTESDGAFVLNGMAPGVTASRPNSPGSGSTCGRESRWPSAAR